MNYINQLPTLRSIHGKVEDGLKAVDIWNVRSTAEKWYQACLDALKVIDSTDIKTLKDFDSRFRSYLSIKELIPFTAYLLSCQGERSEQLVRRDILFCETMLNRFKSELDWWAVPTVRKAIAHMYTHSGASKKAEELLAIWLEEDPLWADGWMSRADCFEYLSNSEDMQKIEEILKKALTVCKPLDRKKISDHFSKSFKHFDKSAEYMTHIEGKDCGQRHARTNRAAVDIFEGLLFELPTRKLTMGSIDTGRRHPCSCGSNDKYKNCCEIKLRCKIVQSEELPAPTEPPNTHLQKSHQQFR